MGVGTVQHVHSRFSEKTQIKSYASKVWKDLRFPKRHIQMEVILITKGVKPELIPTLIKRIEEFGHI